MVSVGDKVTYVDPVRKEHNALIQIVWNSGHPGDEVQPSLNLVYVSDNESEQDQYGRQIKHVTSIPHEVNQHAPGNYWK